jgi:lysophospholipase L1-like esterase
MDVVGERILIFGDSLSHHGADAAPEIWDVNAGSNRASSAPGDLLASMLLEQGAQAVRVDANVGRSAHNFWAGTARRQLHSAQELIASDQAWGPTKVIVMLGTNDADSGAIDAGAMAAIRDAYAGMGAEVWAIGPPIFVSEALNVKADQAFTMMSEVFGDKLIDARPLSSVIGRAGDGVHFQPVAAQQLALQLVSALATTKSSVWNRKPWLGAALGVAIFGTLGYLIWGRYQHGQLGDGEPDGEPDDDDDDDDGELDGSAMHMVDGKKWTRGHSPAAAGYKQIACKAGIPDLNCWASPKGLKDAKLDGRKRVGQLTDEEYAERVRAKKQADEAARVARSAKLLQYKSPLDRVEIALRNLTKAEVAHKKATTICRKNPNTERAWNKTHDDLEASRADYEAARAAYHARQG